MRHQLPRSFGARLLTSAGVLVALGGPWFASCASKPVVDIAVLDPDGLRAGAAWAQLVVFPEDCPAKEALENGDVSGNVKFFTVEADQDFPDVGSLDKDKYGVAVLLRNDQCGVLGFGCTPVNLENHRHITVMLNEKADPAKAACKASDGETCEQGLCTAGSVSEGGTDAPTDQTSPEAGTTCNFKLVKADNFDPPVDEGAAFYGPALVPTPGGFVVVYREINAAGTTARAVRQFVGDDGTKGERANADVPACAGNQATNGITAAWSTSQGAGFMAVSSVVCSGGDAQAYIANFDQDGQTIAEVSYTLPEEITIRSAGGSTAYPTSTQYLLAAVSLGAPALYTFDGVNVNSNIGAIQNGGGISTFAQIAAAPQIVATLADSDSEGGRVALSVQPPGSGTISTSFLPTAPFAALTVWDDRVLAAIPESNMISWNAVNAEGESVSDGTFTGGPFNSVDATTLGDHAILAAGAPAKITLFRVDDITGTMAGGSSFQTTLASPLGGATLSNFDGTRMAVAAIRNRVVVAWINSTAPVGDATTAPGGYAVLACDN